MRRVLRTTLMANNRQVLAQVTPAEWEQAVAQFDNAEMALRIPVRLTINGEGEAIAFERVDRKIPPNQVGKNPVIEGEKLTIDALMAPGIAGDICPGVGTLTEQSLYFMTVPFVMPVGGLQGYAHEHYRLRSVFLPCPLDSYKSMRQAIALVDIATQTVESLTYRKSVNDAPLGLVVNDNTPGKIEVVAFLSNGGCNFSCVIE